MLDHTSSTVKRPDVVTVVMTAEQYDILRDAFAEAKRRDMAIREWTGESVEEIEDRYQLPPDDVLEDMADYQASVRTGINMF